MVKIMSNYKPFPSGLNVSGKFVTQITTSKHFYDVTAHNYIQQNCQELGMKYIKGLSADMDDLLTVNGRKCAKEFFEYVCWCIEHVSVILSGSCAV